MNRVQVEQYLGFLAGAPELALSEEAPASLYFDECQVDFLLAPQSLSWRSALLQLDAGEAEQANGAAPTAGMLALLLEANFLGRGAGGAMFAMTDEGVLLLQGRVLLEGLTELSLEALLQSFVAHAEFWQQQLRAGIGGNEP